jgi:hypothetical protein
MRISLEGLYPVAKTVIVDSNHQIQVATPEVVMQAMQRFATASNFFEHDPAPDDLHVA